MSAICPVCGREDWSEVVRVITGKVLRNDNEEREERFETSSQAQTRLWECDGCGHREADNGEAAEKTEDM